MGWDRLEALMDEVDRQAAPPPVWALAEELAGEKGVGAVLFYGSCRRGAALGNGIADLYLLVDSYTAYHGRGLKAVVGRVLPPNVAYRETATPHGPARAKCAILSLRDFERGTSPAWFHSYLWARFAQPAPLLFVRDAGIRERVRRARANAARTFLERSLPLTPGRFRPARAWCRGLALSYGAELRTEDTLRIRKIYRADRAFFQEVLAAARDLLPFPVWPLEEEGGEEPEYRLAVPARARRRARAAWTLRRAQGRGLSLLRLAKAAFTFRGGTDYILWKIARHTGRRVEPRPWQRRHPLLAAPILLWKLAREDSGRASGSGGPRS